MREGYNRIAAHLGMTYTKCSGMDYRTIITFDSVAGEPLEMKSLLQHELIKRGILWNDFHTISFSHSDADISYTLEAYRDALPIVHDAVLKGTVRKALRGTPIEPVFRRIQDFNTKPKWAVSR